MASGEKAVTLTQLDIVKQYVDENFQTATKVNTAIATHNADETAHPFIQNKIGEVIDKVRVLEIVVSGSEVTANPFAVTFGSLDGTVSDGIWNPTDMTLGF